MQSKNYYTILKLDPSATGDEIKKAYRQLAIKYHPDKNNGEEVAANHFREIQEAYQTLSDPHRRAAYNQKRWYKTHALTKDHMEPLTAFTLFTKANELKLYIRKLHAADINRTSLLAYIRYLLNARSLAVLKQANDVTVNQQLVLAIMEVMEPLSAADKAIILVRLKSIADPETDSLIDNKLKENGRMKLWEQYQVLLILVIALLLCLLIYRVSN